MAKNISNARTLKVRINIRRVLSSIFIQTTMVMASNRGRRNRTLHKAY